MGSDPTTAGERDSLEAFFLRLLLLDNLKQEADGIFSGLSGISPAQGLDKSKASFVAAATSLQAWCNTAGVASSIQGL